MVRRASQAPAATLIALLVLACTGGGTGEDVAPARVPLVEAVAARSGSLPVEETVSGMVRARNQVAIRPELSGRVVEVLVRGGEAVEPGRTLVRLDASETRDRLRQAEADVQVEEAAAAASRARAAELETRVARTRALAEEALVSAQELETIEAQLDALRAGAAEAEARVEQARATVDERRSALAKTEVRAPVGGRLGERRVEVGQLVDPSTVLFVVGDLDELIVEVTLTEAALARVSEGQPVEIAPRAETAPVRAALSRISPFLARESFTTRGEIDVDNRDGRLRPGMFVEVRILVGRTDPATLVPVSAVWDNPETGRRGVFVVEESEGLTAGEVTAETEPDPTPRAVAFRAVEILAEGRGEAGVSGVDEGDWVVTVGQHLLGGRTGAEGTGEGAADAAAPSTARVRPVAWERVQALQALQDEDLLEGFLDKQRKLAAAIGAEIPESEDVVDRVLEEAAAAETARPGGP